MQPQENTQRVTTIDQDIPFGRMVILCIKWGLAAIPALVILSFLWALITFAIFSVAAPEPGLIPAAIPVSR